MPATELAMLVSPHSGEGVHDGQQFVAFRPHQCSVAARFDVAAHHGLGVGHAHAEAPVRELHAEAIRVIDQ